MEKLDEHLNLNVRVIDDDGNVIAQGRDVQQLKSAMGTEETDDQIEVAADDPDWSRTGVTDWDFGEWRQEVRLNRGGIQIPAYPAIEDAGESVNLLMFDSSARAQKVSRAGIRRLYCLRQRKALRSQVAWLPELNEVAVKASGVVGADELKAQVRDLMADLAFLGTAELPRDLESFERPLENAVERIGLATQDIAKLLPKLFDALHEARVAIEETSAARYRHATQDCSAHLKRLTARNFLDRHSVAVADRDAAISQSHRPSPRAPHRRKPSQRQCRHRRTRGAVGPIHDPQRTPRRGRHLRPRTGAVPVDDRRIPRLRVRPAARDRLRGVGEAPGKAVGESCRVIGR